MSVQMILAPVFALVFLIFAVMFGMFRVRTRAISTKEVRVSQIAIGQDAWPKQATQISNTYVNLFEMPVLFFALIAFALPLRQADLVIVLLSWVYVALRYLHAVIYATSNDLRFRFGFFAASAMVLLAMWVYFALKLFLAI
ncbi:MAG: MAPEG family protein [Afipia sp.]|nr:MAPEG family protein [Afipia sp.]